MNYARLSRLELAQQLLEPPSCVSERSLDQMDYQGPVDEDALQQKLQMARELLEREALAQLKDKPLLNTPTEVKNWLSLHYAGQERETFLALFLDAGQRLIRAEEMFQGTIDCCPIYPREVAKMAMQCNACCLIVAHNHPSGLTEPSQADIQITRELRDCLRLIGVRLVDHLISAGRQTISMAEKGLMP